MWIHVDLQCSLEIVLDYKGTCIRWFRAPTAKNQMTKKCVLIIPSYNYFNPVYCPWQTPMLWLLRPVYIEFCTFQRSSHLPSIGFLQFIQAEYCDGWFHHFHISYCQAKITKYSQDREMQAGYTNVPQKLIYRYVVGIEDLPGLLKKNCLTW